MRAVFLLNNYSFFISSTPCPFGSAMQHWPTGFGGVLVPQKHGSIVPQHVPYIFPDPHEQSAITFAFCASSIMFL